MKEKNTPRTNQIIEPEGWLDTRTAPILEKQFQEAVKSGAQHIVIDCHSLDYINSAGLRLLKKIASRLAQTRGFLILCSLEEHIGEVFEISGLDSIFPIERNLYDALARLQGIPCC